MSNTISWKKIFHLAKYEPWTTDRLFKRMLAWGVTIFILSALSPDLLMDVPNPWIDGIFYTLLFAFLFCPLSVSLSNYREYLLTRPVLKSEIFLAVLGKGLFVSLLIMSIVFAYDSLFSHGLIPCNFSPPPDAHKVIAYMQCRMEFSCGSLIPCDSPLKASLFLGLFLPVILALMRPWKTTTVNPRWIRVLMGLAEIFLLVTAFVSWQALDYSPTTVVNGRVVPPVISPTLWAILLWTSLLLITLLMGVWSWLSLELETALLMGKRKNEIPARSATPPDTAMIIPSSPSITTFRQFYWPLVRIQSYVITFLSLLPSCLLLGTYWWINKYHPSSVLNSTAIDVPASLLALSYFLYVCSIFYGSYAFASASQQMVPYYEFLWSRPLKIRKVVWDQVKIGGCLVLIPVLAAPLQGILGMILFHQPLDGVACILPAWFAFLMFGLSHQTFWKMKWLYIFVIILVLSVLSYPGDIGERPFLFLLGLFFLVSLFTFLFRWKDYKTLPTRDWLGQQPFWSSL